MYNRKESNAMNKYNEYMKHKGHLERLYLSKSLINNKCPMVPSFFKKEIKNKRIEVEYNYKINQENHNFYKKLIQVVKTNSKYGSLLKIPSKCPAFERKDKIQIKKFKNIINENLLFYKILKRSKSTLDNTKKEKDFLNSRYYKNNISNNRSISNPNIKFATYRQFTNNIKKNLKRKLYINKSINNFDNTYLYNKNKNKKINFPMTYKGNVSMGF